MSELEQRLRRALGRREPTRGFAERVMAEAGKRGPRSSRRDGGWVAAAVVAAMVAGGVWIDAQLNYQARGERARQEVLTALRVTGSALNTVTEGLRDARFGPAGSNESR